MRAWLTQVDGTKFRAGMDGGPEIVLHAAGKDETPEAPSPFQTALLAAMGCTASDIVYILKKERQPITGLEIVAEAERAPSEPRVLTKVHLHYKVYGDGIRESAVQRAVDLSTEKYCSVGIMLRRGGVEWENSFEILPPK